MKKYMGWDIEIFNDLPEGTTDWRQHAPLGITCGAAIAANGNGRNWFAQFTDGVPEARAMSQTECRHMVHDLMQYVLDGYTLVTWNGLSFDFPVLAMESGMHAECAELALNHVDMMYHVVCVKGFGVGLNTVAETMGLTGKLDGMSGKLAPKLWRNGEFDTVLNYVEQDARTTVDVAEKCERLLRMSWTTRRGKRSSMALPQGWLSVRQASELPLPDTSWMGDSSMWQRNHFLDWTGTKA